MSLHVNGRHIAVRDVAQFFQYDHLPPHLRSISQACAELAQAMIDDLPDNPSLTHGLNRLLEAKDAFVRSAVAAQREADEGPV